MRQYIECFNGPIEGFNPRTRKGCDPVTPYFRNWAFNVSIHAPVKDATEQGADGTITIKVSIHAPVKDATS